MSILSESRSGTERQPALARLRIAVLTQEDPFYIPRNVELLCREPSLEVREIVVLDARGSVANMRKRLLEWFGPAAVARMAARAGARAAAEVANRVSGYRLPVAPTSLRAVARRYGVPFHVEKNANAPEVIERLRGHQLDAIVSFSAPQVFRPELLKLPRLGCVNRHCALLPRYRGLLPSVWVLFHGEDESGATI
ncbi:MAG TPA: formyltransferase family protein, partial [Longimicrobium sp.]|nr:formyltransferase family protein [Longimicrobium sp.]